MTSNNETVSRQMHTSVWLDRQPQFSTSTASSSSMVAGADGMPSLNKVHYQSGKCTFQMEIENAFDH